MSHEKYFEILQNELNLIVRRESAMNKKNAFDLPTRVFHWVFAILFVAAFTIANTIDDDSKWYTLHSLSGIMMVFLIFLRGIWGFVGSKYARFSSFKLNPSDLIKYLKSI